MSKRNKTKYKTNYSDNTFTNYKNADKTSLNKNSSASAKNEEKAEEKDSTVSSDNTIIRSVIEENDVIEEKAEQDFVSEKEVTADSEKQETEKSSEGKKEDKTENNQKKESSKKKSSFNWVPVRKAGIFTGVIILMLGILISLTLVSRNSWQKGLGSALKEALDSCSVKYDKIEYVPFDSTLNTYIGIYRISENSTKNNCKYGIILRATTVYGPLPAVFVYDQKTDEAQFITYIGLNGNTEKQITEATRNSQIQYWQKRIPLVMKDEVLTEKEERK